MLLMSPRTYRAQAFVAAAERLGLAVVKVVDTPGALADYWNVRLAFDFADVDEATRRIVEFAAQQPLAAILSVDDSAVLLAARASAALGLPHNSPQAAEAARDKHLMRTLLANGGARVPQFRLCSTADDFRALSQQVAYPCVVKPTRLSGSRGVMRADDPDQFVAAAERLKELLFSIDPAPEPKPFLVEDFIPGFEVALEGVLNRGELKVLALFDKPDPLDGPFFEETIYVTPSRVPLDVQRAIGSCASDAARALGLREGPVHAELRVNDEGPWLVEVAGRSIGGLCSKTLRFGTDVSLEELILRQACGLDIDSLNREKRAGGVMMIPIPEAGILRGVEGEADALAVPGIEEIQITTKVNNAVVPLPEGDSYLGFIFARGESPENVEAALRQAHRRLRFDIEPVIPLLAAT
jgi:biotin carboxylase